MTRILSKFRASNSAGLGEVPESPGRGNASWEIRLCFERSKLRQTKLHHTFSLTPKFYRQISPIRRRLRIRIWLSGSGWFVLVGSNPNEAKLLINNVNANGAFGTNLNPFGSSPKTCLSYESRTVETLAGMRVSCWLIDHQSRSAKIETETLEIRSERN